VVRFKERLAQLTRSFRIQIFLLCSDAQLAHVADVRQAVRFAVSEIKHGDLLPGDHYLLLITYLLAEKNIHFVCARVSVFVPGFRIRIHFIRPDPSF
jgi:hypothetical protein